MNKIFYFFFILFFFSTKIDSYYARAVRKKIRINRKKRVGSWVSLLSFLFLKYFPPLREGCTNLLVKAKILNIKDKENMNFFRIHEESLQDYSKVRADQDH